MFPELECSSDVIYLGYVFNYRLFFLGHLVNVTFAIIRYVRADIRGDLKAGKR